MVVISIWVKITKLIISIYLLKMGMTTLYIFYRIIVLNLYFLKDKGASFLYMNFQNGYDNTVQLDNSTNTNWFKDNEAFSSCYSLWKLAWQHCTFFLVNGTDINLSEKNGGSPFHKACEIGHDSIVQHLVNNSADINLCQANWISPFLIACQNLQDNTSQFFEEWCRY